MIHSEYISAERSPQNLYIAEDAIIYGREQIFIEQEIQPLAEEAPPCLYIAEDAIIYGREQIFVKQEMQPVAAKMTKSKGEKSNEREELDEITTDDCTTQEEATIILCPLPVTPAPSFSVIHGGMSATVPQTQRNNNSKNSNKGAHLFACIILNRGNSNWDKFRYALFHTEQRQNLSPAAIQCGVLTSLGVHSPPSPVLLCIHSLI
jgi:hypothetical protein